MMCSSRRRPTRRGRLYFFDKMNPRCDVWDDYDDVSLDDLIGAGSVFLGIDLPIGQLQLGYGRTFDGRDSSYLMFGSLVLPRYRERIDTSALRPDITTSENREWISH